MVMRANVRYLFPVFILFVGGLLFWQPAVQAQERIVYPIPPSIFVDQAFATRFDWHVATSTRIALVPHHLVAARQIAALFSVLPSFRTLVIIGPDHFSQGKTAFTSPSPNAIFCSPELSVNACAAGQIDGQALSWLEQGVPMLREDALPFAREHAIYNELPFLGHAQPNVRIVPILIRRDATSHDLATLTHRLSALLRRDQTIGLVASVDLSHYQIEEVADFHDELVTHALQSLDTRDVNKLEVNSQPAIQVMLSVASQLGLRQADILSHTNSLRLTKAILERESTSHIIAVYSASSTLPEIGVIPRRIFRSEFWYQRPKINTKEDRLYYGYQHARIFREATLPYDFGIIRDGDALRVYAFPFQHDELLTRKERHQRIVRNLPRLTAWLNRQLKTKNYHLLY